MATDIPSNKYTCSQPDCKFPIDSECVEGLGPPLTCPFRSLATDKLETGTLTSNKPPVVEATKIPIHKGRALTDEACDSIMAGSPTTLIVLAGLKDCGKSTLLASLMQLFQDRVNFIDYNFAGSQTLIEFEQICFLSRMKSGRDEAHTARTVKGFDGVLHLTVRHIDKHSKRKELLFTNLSGEDFEHLSNSTEACKSFVIAKRANYFILFLDSGLLSQLSARQAAKTNSINVLIGLLDAGMLAPATRIQIIFSKWDRLLSKDEQEMHKAFVEQIKVDVTQRVLRYNFTVDFFEIASRPKSNEVLQFGHGLDKLFKTWVTPIEEIPFKFTPTTVLTPIRSFSRFKYLS